MWSQKDGELHVSIDPNGTILQLFYNYSTNAEGTIYTSRCSKNEKPSFSRAGQWRTNLDYKVKTMKKAFIRALLTILLFTGAGEGGGIASKVGVDKALVEREGRKIEQMTGENDIEGLIEMLANGTFPSKVRVATYLKDTGDKRALAELERANRELGGWDLRSPCDDRSGIFAIAIWKISTNELSHREKGDTLIELLEGKGPIVPELQIYDTITVNGDTKKLLRVAGPNYHVGVCAEQELDQFDEPSVTTRLRKVDNKGIAAYAVWREVRDMSVEDAIVRCVEITNHYKEGRTQRYGAIHCLERFEHPNAILALDVLAEEGKSEAIRALQHFGSKPDVFDRLCNHLLHNPYYVVRLFAVSPVRFVKTESFRAKSLKTLVTALYDPSEQVRRSAAQSLCNYIFPVNEEQVAVIRDDLLLASKHPDGEVRGQIRKALTRMGWLDSKMPERKTPSIRTDIMPNVIAIGGGIRECMIVDLKGRVKDEERKGETEKVEEIYTKLSILDPQNESYRSHLRPKTPH